MPGWCDVCGLADRKSFSFPPAARGRVHRRYPGAVLLLAGQCVVDRPQVMRRRVEGLLKAIERGAVPGPRLNEPRSRMRVIYAARQKRSLLNVV